MNEGKENTGSNTLRSSRQVYTNTWILVRRAAYSIIIIIDQVQLLLRYRTRCLRNKKRKTVITEQQQRRQHYVCKTDFSIALTQQYFYTGTKKSRLKNQDKTLRAGLEPQKPRSNWQQPICSPTYCGFIKDHFSDLYVFIRTNGRLRKNDKPKKYQLYVGRQREHGLGRYLQGREGRAR